MPLPIPKVMRTYRIATLNFLNNPHLYTERIESLKQELLILNPDVLSLQEVIFEKLPELVTMLKSIGLYKTAEGNKSYHKYKNLYSGNVTFSKDRNIKPGLLVSGGSHDIPVHVSEIEGKEIHILNAHFEFSDREEIRVEQAYNATQYAKKVEKENPNTIVVLNGDLNAVPNSDTIRYLNVGAVYEDTSATWTDAFFQAKNPENPDTWVTSNPDTQWGRETAKAHNNTLFPEMIPKRRIDYIFVHGWVYGRIGSPMSYGTWAKTAKNPETSDHYGVYTDILISVN